MLHPPTPPLLSLPAELRNLIYSYVFANQTIEPVPEPWRQRNDTTIRDPIVLTLLHVNRQLHAETRLLPYRDISFAFTSTRTLNVFVAKRSQEQLDFIQSLQIESMICFRMLQDEKLWAPEQFRNLASMPALKRIDVVDVQGWRDSEVFRARGLRRMVKCIRKWRAEVKVVARDDKGRWNFNM